MLLRCCWTALNIVLLSKALDFGCNGQSRPPRRFINLYSPHQKMLLIPKNKYTNYVKTMRNGRKYFQPFNPKSMAVIKGKWSKFVTWPNSFMSFLRFFPPHSLKVIKRLLILEDFKWTLFGFNINGGIKPILTFTMVIRIIIRIASKYTIKAQ